MACLPLSLLVFLACLAQALALAQYTAYNYGFDVKTRVKRQLARRSDLVVQDKIVGGGDVVVRQEIRQLEQDTDLWTLYILALSMMQFTDQESPTSYYGLAGIHGMPHRTWGGVKPVAGSENTGYCTHSSVLFPTWHRPYMALYEQVLYGLIQTIATFWPDDQRPRYEAAARRFRHPYWDWAAAPPAGESVLPNSIGGNPYVDIDGPSGRQRIANPLFSYSFKPLDATAFGFGPWNTWTRTLRGPLSISPDAQSNNSFVAMNLDQNRPSIAQRLYALFSSYDNYTTFSSNTFGAQADSIESLHDTIHSLVGGFGPGQPTQAGHMAFIQWSAFDPIFFLHHCMVDRVLAIWQTLHPTEWVTASRALTNSYTIRRGQTLSATTPLTPFFANDNGTFWDSDGVRDHTRFGYTYAELVRASPTGGGGGNTKVAAHPNTTKQAINRLYGAFSPASLFLKELRASGLKTSSSENTENTQPDNEPKSEGGRQPPTKSSKKLFVGDHYHEWTANVRVGSPALADASAIHFFLGDAPREPGAWAAAPNRVGAMGVFGSSAGTPGGDRGRESHHDMEVAGTVPLTAALVGMVEAGELESLEPEDVEGLLRRGLNVRVLGRDGEVAEGVEGCVQGVGVAVVSSLVRAPGSEEELPRWGEGRVWLEMC